MKQRELGAAGILLNVVLWVIIAGCGKDEKMMRPNPRPVSQFLSGVEVEGATVQLRTGDLPGSTGGPGVNATGNSQVINGGSSRINVSAGVPLSRVLVSVGGAEGYYEVSLSAPSTSAEIVITIAQSIPGNSFDCVYTGVGADGLVGAPREVPATVTRVGSGDIQISVSWDASSDVDLHVVDPAGEEVYYGNREIGSGGVLDLDSNAACIIDDVRNENVIWPAGTAPRGTYIVRVDYYRSCDVEKTNYIVTVIRGGQTDTFAGVFTGEGDMGGLGDGVEVTRFDF